MKIDLEIIQVAIYRARREGVRELTPLELARICRRIEADAQHAEQNPVRLGNLIQMSLNEE